jgi:nucleotide-binding universal stress UspA family protein
MHVLLPVDGSDIAREATKRGLALLTGAAKVTILSVVSVLPGDTGGGIEGPIYTPEQEEELRHSAEQHASNTLADTRALLQ